MFALVETWFSSLPSSPVPLAGKTPTRTARAIATCIRGVINALAPPPALLRPLQLLFAICICGEGKVGKSARIQAVVRMGIEGFGKGSAAPAGLDAAQFGDLIDAVEFLFPTAGEQQQGSEQK